MPNYSIDPVPGVPVGQIRDSRLRCLSVIARATNWRLGDQSAAIRIGGAGAMIDGLCYHFQRYMENRRPMESMLEAQKVWMASRGVGEDPFLKMRMERYVEFEAVWTNTHHETVAYLNRLGQLLAFAKAQSVDFSSLAPHSWRLTMFRHKHAAHRAIDQPRAETLSEQYQFAMVLDQSFAVRDGDIFHSVEYEGKPLHLCLRRDHPVVLDETAAWLQTAFPSVF